MASRKKIEAPAPSAVVREDMPRLIHLSKLCVSDANVRGKGSKKDDEQLADDIAAHGVLQNLVVQATTDGAGFEVIAGGRRFRALKILQKRGVIDGDYMVPASVRALADNGAELSLAENVQRVAMNPADEAVAFAKLAEDGASAADIAARFGLTERHVKGRLRLASLAEPVLEALRGGKISLDQAQAFASVPDPVRQAKVFKEARGEYARSPDAIRRAMAEAGVDPMSTLAIMIGRDAYIAAGGRIECDLFSDVDTELWLDADVVERVAFERLEAFAEEVKTKHGFGEVRVELRGYAPYTYGELTRCPQDSLDFMRVDAETKAGLLVFVGPDRVGGPPKVLNYAYYLDASKVPPEPVAPRRAPEPQVTPSDPNVRSADDAGSDDGKGKLSQRLLDELAMQRRDVLALAIARAPDLAYDLAVFMLVDKSRPSGAHWYNSSELGTSLSAVQPEDPIKSFGDGGCPWAESAANVQLAEIFKGLDRTWCDGATAAARFDSFRLIEASAKAAWLAYAVAKTMKASAHGTSQTGSAFHSHIGGLLAIDVAAVWRPTAENYFGRGGKALALAILEDVGGVPTKGKRGELVERAERLAAGKQPLVDDKGNEAGAQWVPEPMRFDSPPVPVEDVDRREAA